MTSPNMSTPRAGQGTAMVRTRVLDASKTADVRIISSGIRQKPTSSIKSAKLAGSVRQIDGFAVWRTSIGFSPSLFAGEHLVWIREGFRTDETFERRQPVL